MLRTGIYNCSQLKQQGLKDIFGKEKNISIYLYKQINQLVDDIEEKTKYAEVILNRFNSDRNVIKRTYKNRFNNFDNASIAKIAEQNKERISIMDIAISDGRASCFFLEQSIKQLKQFYYTGSDLQVDYILNKKEADSKSYVVIDAEKKIIEITHPPFVWNFARPEGKIYFINNFLKRFFFKKNQIALLSNKFSYQEKIELLHPDYISILNQSSQFKITNYNLFNKISGKYNVIRAMNILHWGYFTKEQLNTILTNLYEGLENDGVLIEGSNENVGSPVEGAIYRKCEQGFILLSEPEKSSRIKELVLSFKYDK